jgi:hypothetical protein
MPRPSSTPGDESREAEVMAGLQSAAGFLRRELAGSLGLRAAPIIRFQWDPRLRYVEEVDKLLNEPDIKPDDTLLAADTAAPTPSSDVVELDELDDIEADEGNENDPEQADKA